MRTIADLRVSGVGTNHTLFEMCFIIYLTKALKSVIIDRLFRMRSVGKKIQKHMHVSLLTYH